jgi:hypothetical protein
MSHDRLTPSTTWFLTWRGGGDLLVYSMLVQVSWHAAIPCRSETTADAEGEDRAAIRGLDKASVATHMLYVSSNFGHVASW